jgi:hypothetical protein
MSDPNTTELSAETFDEITGQPNNRRNRERRAYRISQWIAGCNETELPGPNPFGKCGATTSHVAAFPITPLSRRWMSFWSSA